MDQGTQISVAVALSDIARRLEAKGKVKEALVLHRQARKAFAALGDRRLFAGALVQIANLLALRGKIDTALQLNRKALEVFEALDDRHWKAATLARIATLLWKRGLTDEAWAFTGRRWTFLRPWAPGVSAH